MLVDDDLDILSVIKRGLENDGYGVHSFHDPVLALSHVEQDCKDCELLITDVRMPHMNGFQLVRRVRELKPKIKVVMMTAFDMNMSEFESVFRSMNLEGVLEKPFLPSKLVETIKEIYATEK